VFSPYLTLGLGWMWSTHTGAGGVRLGEDEEGIAHVGAGLQIRLWRLLTVAVEARAAFTGREDGACAGRCTGLVPGDGHGLQGLLLLGWGF
jgi:hypothetical protein